jgi:hypothetical protein
MMKRLQDFIDRPYTLAVLGIAMLVGICTLNYLLFKVIAGRSYLDWYLDTGPVFALVTVIAASVYEGFDKDPELISAHPLRYAASYLKVVAMISSAMALVLRKRKHGWSTIEQIFDIVRSLAEISFTVVIVVSAVAWLIVIVPLQYFIFLICGSVPRSALSSSTRVVAWNDERGHFHIEEREASLALPKNAWDATMRDNPFSVTSAISAAFLFFLSKMLTYAALS